MNQIAKVTKEKLFKGGIKNKQYEWEMEGVICWKKRKLLKNRYSIIIFSYRYFSSLVDNPSFFYQKVILIWLRITKK